MVTVQGRMDTTPEGASLRLPLYYRKRIKEYLSGKEDRVFVIDIKIFRKLRSKLSNNYFHKICRVLGSDENVQMSMEDVKQGVKWRAADEHGYPLEVNKLSKYEEPMSSAKADQKEFSILIDTAFDIAGELGAESVYHFYIEYLAWKKDQELADINIFELIGLDYTKLTCCPVCGGEWKFHPHSGRMYELAHILSKTDKHYARYGAEIIDSDANKVPVCSLRCNDKVVRNYGSRPLECDAIAGVIKDKNKGEYDG